MHVSMFFYSVALCFFHTPFSSNSHMMDFFLQFMTYSVCNLSIRVQEKRDDTEEEALQNKGADSSDPPACTQPPEFCTWGPHLK